MMLTFLLTPIFVPSSSISKCLYWDQKLFLIDCYKSQKSLQIALLSAAPPWLFAELPPAVKSVLLCLWISLDPVSYTHLSPGSSPEIPFPFAGCRRRYLDFRVYPLPYSQWNYWGYNGRGRCVDRFRERNRLVRFPAAKKAKPAVWARNRRGLFLLCQRQYRRFFSNCRDLFGAKYQRKCQPDWDSGLSTLSFPIRHGWYHEGEQKLCRKITWSPL